MFKELKRINSRPSPFEFYTAEELWTNEHTSKEMLKYHLNDDLDVSSRNKAFIDRSVEWIVKHFNVNGETVIADFGCGPGLYTLRLAEKGAVVTGIDFSRNSLNYADDSAASKGLDIKYVHSNYLYFETEDRYDLIMMIMCDFCALGPEQRSAMLLKFSSFLKPGGSLLLDVNSLHFFSMRDETAFYELNQLNGFWSPNDYYCFVNTFKYENEKVILDKYTVVEEGRTTQVYNWMQCYSPDSLKVEFEAHGLSVAEVYADVAGTPFDENGDTFAVVAVKG